MGRSRRRRDDPSSYRRAQPVRTYGYAFNDSADSIADPVFGRGAEGSPANRRLPPSGVRRLLDIDASPDVRLFRGMGRSPMQATRFPQLVGGVAPVLSVRRPIAPLKVQRALDWQIFQTLQVRAPKKVSFCVRRKARREVLFALKRAGFSGSAPHSYRRTAHSHWSC